MNLYWRPGSHNAAILAASACALSASRNSSTNRMFHAPLLDAGFCQRFQFVRVGLADALQELKGGRGLALVDLRQGEADVDQDPFAGLGRVVREQADVDHPPHPTDVHAGQVGLVGEALDDLTGYAEAHMAPCPLSQFALFNWSGA